MANAAEDAKRIHGEVSRGGVRTTRRQRVRGGGIDAPPPAAAEATLGAARDEYEDARDEYEDGYSFVGDEDGVRTGARTRSNVFGDADGDVVFGDVDGDRFGDRFGDVGDSVTWATAIPGATRRGGARSDLEGYASGVAASGADDGVDALVASVTAAAADSEVEVKRRAARSTRRGARRVRRGRWRRRAGDVRAARARIPRGGPCVPRDRRLDIGWASARRI